MSQDRKNGGPAFPYSHKYGNVGMPGGEVTEMAEGMSLRDYFAAKAMQGHMASLNAGSPETNEGWMAACAKSYYMMADAMLKASEQ